jgi:hypothetical protein
MLKHLNDIGQVVKIMFGRCIKQLLLLSREYILNDASGDIGQVISLLCVVLYVKRLPLEPVCKFWFECFAQLPGPDLNGRVGLGLGVRDWW